MSTNKTDKDRMDDFFQLLEPEIEEFVIQLYKELRRNSEIDIIEKDTLKFQAFGINYNLLGRDELAFKPVTLESVIARRIDFDGNEKVPEMISELRRVADKLEKDLSNDE